MAGSFISLLAMTAKRFSNMLAFSYNAAPRISAYLWDNGFSTKYANANTSAITNGPFDLTISPDKKTVAIGSNASITMVAYPFSLMSGFGSAYASPANLPPNTVNELRFHPANNAIAAFHANSPFVSVYPWSISGFGTRYSAPAAPPAAGLTAGSFSSTGNEIILAGSSLYAYPWTGSGFGTKFVNGSGVPGFSSFGSIRCNPSNTVLSFGVGVAPWLFTYAWSSSGFGTKYADPIETMSGPGQDIAWHPDGNTIICVNAGTEIINAYPWTGSGFGTRYALPFPTPSGTGTTVAFSNFGDTVAIGTTAGLTVWPWSSSGFGTQYANPSGITSSSITGLEFN